MTFSNPLLHYLLERPNVLRRDVLLQAKPEEQAADRRRAAASATGGGALDVARVRAARAEPARPAVRLDARSTTTSTAQYRLAARFGDYEVLVPRSSASR